MLRKIIACALALVLMSSASICVFATDERQLIAEQSAPGAKYTSISTMSLGINFKGSTATGKIIISTKKTAEIDRIVVSVKLMKVGSSTPVKSWGNSTLYKTSTDEFFWADSYNVTSRGTYYFSATIKTYRGNTLVETTTVESGRATY